MDDGLEWRGNSTRTPQYWQLMDWRRPEGDRLVAVVYFSLGVWRAHVMHTLDSEDYRTQELDEAKAWAVAVVRMS